MVDDDGTTFCNHLHYNHDPMQEDKGERSAIMKDENDLIMMIRKTSMSEREEW